MEAQARSSDLTSSPVPLRIIAVLGMGWAAVALSVAGGLLSLSLIDQVVLLGVAVVLPLAIGGPAWWWAAAAVATVVSLLLLLPGGWAGLLIVPLALAAASCFTRLRLGRPADAWDLGEAAELLAPAYALVAAGTLTASRTGLEPFGIGEPIVETRVLLCISGPAVWVPMVLAVGWAAGQHWDVPALSVPDMARTHGLPTAMAFTLCGLLSRRRAVATISHPSPVAPA